MAAATPPYRADHVGSLLRSDAVKAKRHAYYDDHAIPHEELEAAEDAAIRTAIKVQQDVGLPVVTDGEIRRAFWHYDFLDGLTGFDLERRSEGAQFAGTQMIPVHPVISERFDFPADHPHIAHFKFVAANTSVMPKISIPGPSCAHFRTAPDDIHVKAYRDDLQAMFDDLARTYATAVKAFYDAGCRYLQMDDIFFAYLCDPKHREAKKKLGQDPDWLVDRYAWMMHEAIKDKPADMWIGMHMCRGNFKNTYAAEGSYDLVADTVFNKTGVDIFFMEYDTDRAGGLEPLKFLAKGKQRVLPGFISTKVAELEKLDDLRRKFDEASKYADIAQLGIAPQCGFASTEEGNAITEDGQKRKLDLVVKTAEAIWGGVAK
jgi:5-methyltetrahydropteroyltriglutamate--homocysteine methyltransferase